MIEPTVGRIVYYVPNANSPEHKMAAIITDVQNSRKVSLTVFGPDGSVFSRQSVTLVQGKSLLSGDPYCHWMPYQIGQAAKTEQLEKEIDTGKKAKEDRYPHLPVDISFNFGRALEFLKSGYRVMRNGWNGKGMWLALQRPDEGSMNTLPYIYIEYPKGHVAYPNGSRVPWLASQTDMLCDDWKVLLEPVDEGRDQTNG